MAGSWLQFDLLGLGLLAVWGEFGDRTPPRAGLFGALSLACSLGLSRGKQLTGGHLQGRGNALDDVERDIPSPALHRRHVGPMHAARCRKTLLGVSSLCSQPPDRMA